MADSIIMPDTKTQFLGERNLCRQLLEKVLGSGGFDATSDTINNPDRDVQELCFETCKWLGMAELCGYKAPSGTTVLNPFIVRAAIPELVRRASTLAMFAHTLAPTSEDVYPFGKNKVVATAEAVDYISKINEVFAAVTTTDQLHQALHEGTASVYLVKLMGSDGMLWAGTKFCPTYHLAAGIVEELMTTLNTKRKIMYSIVQTDYADRWREAFSSTGTPTPWWFDRQYTEELRKHVDKQ